LLRPLLAVVLLYCWGGSTSSSTAVRVTLQHLIYLQMLFVSHFKDTVSGAVCAGHRNLMNPKTRASSKVGDSLHPPQTWIRKASESLAFAFRDVLAWSFRPFSRGVPGQRPYNPVDSIACFEPKQL
jgi:hypothetical protein